MADQAVMMRVSQIQIADAVLAEADLDPAVRGVGRGTQAHGQALEGLAHVEQSRVVAQPTFLRHFSNLQVQAVFEARQHFREDTRADLIAADRRLQVQRFVRPFVVVFVAEAIEVGLARRASE